MAKITFFNGNRGVWGYQQLDKYDPTKATTLSNGNTVLTYSYNAADYGASADHPQKIKVVVQDIEYDDASLNPGDGVVKKMTYMNGSKKLLEVTKMNVDIQDQLDGLQGYSLYNALLATNNLYVGSNDSKADDWDGDVINTSGGNDVVRANDGDDYINDGGGKDRYFGGEGNDTVSYANHDTSILVKLGAGKIIDGDGVVDRIDSIERVRGTAQNDKMVGDANDNRFAGLAGNDNLNGGAGDDDELRYDRDARYGGTEGIVANMGKGKVRDGFGDIDTVKGFERVRGTDYDDKFIDNGGRDGYQGRGGDDIFLFKGGNDWAQGGDGADAFIFKGNFDYDWIGDFDASEGDTLEIIGASSMSDLNLRNSSDGYVVIEFGDNSVELDGVALADVQASWFVF